MSQLFIRTVRPRGPISPTVGGSTPPRILALVLALAAACLSPAIARADEEVIRFPQTLANLGAISDDQLQYHAFSFVNTTTRTVKLGMSYCHFCTPPVLDKDVIKPGESGTIVLELNPASHRGPMQASATLYEEGRPKSAVTVELKADVCPRVWVEPANMFPRIVKDVGASARFTAMGRGKDFKVLRVESELPLDGIDIGEPRDIQDCGSTARISEVTVRFPKDAPLGPWGTHLKVITSDPEAGPRQITVDGSVIGRVGFQPPNIGLRLSPGESFCKTFELVSDELVGGPIILDSLDITARDEATDLALDFSPTVNPGRIRITLCGTAPLRPRQAVDIRLEAVARTLGSSGTETLTIPILLVVADNTPR